MNIWQRLFSHKKKTTSGMAQAQTPPPTPPPPSAPVSPPQAPPAAENRGRVDIPNYQDVSRILYAEFCPHLKSVTKSHFIKEYLERDNIEGHHVTDSNFVAAMSLMVEKVYADKRPKFSLQLFTDSNCVNVFIFYEKRGKDTFTYFHVLKAEDGFFITEPFKDYVYMR
jgi:hypothetical protein